MSLNSGGLDLFFFALPIVRIVLVVRLTGNFFYFENKSQSQFSVVLVLSRKKNERRVESGGRGEQTPRTVIDYRGVTQHPDDGLF